MVGSGASAPSGEGQTGCAGGQGPSVWLAAVVAELDIEDEEYEVKEEIKFDDPDVGAPRS